MITLNPELCWHVMLTLGHFVWQGAAIALAASAAAWLFRSASSQARYVVWVAALVLMALCPAGTFLYLSSPADRPQTPAAIAVVTAPPGQVMEIAPLPALAGETQRPASPVPPMVGAPVVHKGADWRRFAPQIMTAYLLGVALMFARLLLAVNGGVRLRRTAEPVADPGLLELIGRRARGMGLRFVPAVAFCRAVVAPTVVGVLRPMILLPISFASGLSAVQVEAILAHELAHIRRYDYLVNLFQRVVEAMLFFHPAVWFVSRRIRVERENCCDDMVVAAGCEPLSYAESLVAQAERSLAARARRCAAPGVAALYADGGSGDLRSRVARILKIPSDGEVRLRRVWPLAVMALIALSIATAFALNDGARPERSASAAQNSADFRYRVFEASSADADRLIPQAGRQPVKGSIYSMAQLSPAEIGSLVGSVKAKPGVLVDRLRTITGWPKVAEAWTYAWSDLPDAGGTGRGAGFLGVRSTRNGQEIRIEYNVRHDNESTSPLKSTVFYQGKAPAANGLVFLALLKGKDGSDLYHIVAFEIGGAGTLDATPGADNTNPPSEALAKADQAQQGIYRLEAAISWFRAQAGRNPTSEEGLAALMKQPERIKGWKCPDIRDVLNDPWGRPYVYLSTGKRDSYGFDLFSLGPDGMKGTEDDVTTWSVPTWVEPATTEMTTGEQSWAQGEKDVQARLRPLHSAWQVGQTPKLSLAVRNRGETSWRTDGLRYAMGCCCWLEWDGKWYVWSEPPRSYAGNIPLLGRGDQLDVAVPLDNWVLVNGAQRLPLVLTPGRHLARVRLKLDAHDNPMQYAQAVSNPVEIEIVPADTHPQEAITLSFDSETMQNICALLRQKCPVRLCLENLDFDKKRDGITLEQAIEQLEGAAKQRHADDYESLKGKGDILKRLLEDYLTPAEQKRLLLARKFLAEGNPKAMLFDLGSRYSGQFTAGSVDELLTQITKDTPYAWRKVGDTYVVLPAAGSKLAYPVTLTTDGLTVEQAVQHVTRQRPAGSTIGLSLTMGMLVKEGEDPTPWLRAKAPAMELKGTPALEALCRITEGARPDSVWDLGGYRDARGLGILRGPKDGAAPAAGQPAAQPGVSASDKQLKELCRDIVVERLRREVLARQRASRAIEREIMPDPDKPDRVLENTANSENVRRRRVATAKLVDWADQEKVCSRLAELAKDKDAFVKLNATGVLASQGKKENVEFLLRIASGAQTLSSSESERDDAAWILLALGERLPAAANDHSKFQDQTLEMIRTLQNAGQEIGPEVLSRLAKKGQPAGEPSSRKETNLKAILPSGTEIELVAVSGYPDKDQPWWRPDGTKLDAPPIDPLDFDITSNHDPNSRKIELVFRVGGKADQPAYWSEIRRSDGGGVWWAGRRRTRDGKIVADLKVVGTKVPVDSKTVGLDLLVAAGPWETVATSDGRKAQGPLGAATPGDPAASSGPSTVITARYDPDKLDAQLIGIDTDGGKHAVRGFDIRRGANDAGANFLFQGLTPGQLKSFTLQTRPNNELIRLTDISLVPGQQTDAKLTAATPAAQPEIAWGQVVRGLQAGLRFADQARAYQVGERVNFAVLVRNTGDKAVTVVDYGSLGSPTVRTLDGKSLFVGGPTYNRPVQARKSELKPGAVFEVGQVGLYIGEDKKQRSVQLTPGKYLVSQTCRFHDASSGRATWSGELTTSDITLSVVAADGSSVNKAPATPPTQGAAWGEEKTGLRCRWVDPPGPVIAGTRPHLSVEVQNSSNAPVLWMCGNERSWGLADVTDSLSSTASVYTMPKFDVTLGAGVRPATGEDTGSYRFEPGASLILTAELPWVLNESGKALIASLVRRYMPNNNRDPKPDSPEGPMLCPILALTVVKAETSTATKHAKILAPAEIAEGDFKLKQKFPLSIQAKVDGRPDLLMCTGISFDNHIDSGTLRALVQMEWGSFRQRACAVRVELLDEQDKVLGYAERVFGMRTGGRPSTTSGNTGEVSFFMGASEPLLRAKRFRLSVQSIESDVMASVEGILDLQHGLVDWLTARQPNSQGGMELGQLKVRSLAEGHATAGLTFQYQQRRDERCLARVELMDGQGNVLAKADEPLVLVGKDWTPGQMDAEGFGGNFEKREFELDLGRVDLKAVTRYRLSLRQQAIDPSTPAATQTVPISPEAVVDSLVAAISAIEKDYPELEGFSTQATSRQEELEMRFSRHVGRYSEWGNTRPDGVGAGGISLNFLIRDESNPGWMELTDDNPPLFLKALKKVVVSRLVLSPTPSAGLEQKLGAILAEHRAMLVQLDNWTRRRPTVSMATPAAQTADSGGWGDMGTDGLRIRLIIPAKEGQTPEVTAENVNAALEVWNTGDKAVKIAEQNLTGGRLQICDDWMIGLGISVRDGGRRVRRFFRADDVDSYWSKLGGSPNATAIGPGEKARFGVQLRRLVDMEGTNLLSLKGEFELQPNLRVRGNCPGVWKGDASGGWVPVMIGGAAGAEPKAELPWMSHEVKVGGEVVFADGRKAPEGLDVCVFVVWRDTRPPISFNGADYNDQVAALVKTDAQGNFSACAQSHRGPDQAVYTAVAFAWSPDGLTGGCIKLAPDTHEKVKIVLEKMGSATLSVLGPDGEGIAGGTVVLTPPGRGWDPPFSKAPVTVKDLGQGRYRVEKMIPRLGHCAYVQAKGYIDEYPGDRRPIVVGPGEQVEVTPIKLKLVSKKEEAPDEKKANAAEPAAAADDGLRTVSGEDFATGVATNVPAGLAAARDAVLAAADAKIRTGILALGERFPHLKKAGEHEVLKGSPGNAVRVKESKYWDALSRASLPGCISISFFHTDKGKGATTREPMPETERVSVMVAVRTQPPEAVQLAMFPLYPKLGLVGQIGISAGNPELDAALHELVAAALEPLKALDEKAGHE